MGYRHSCETVYPKPKPKTDKPSAVPETPPTETPVEGGEAEKKKRLPSGWKDFGSGPLCKACVKTIWCVRTISLPVHKILGRWVEEEVKDAKGKAKMKKRLVPVPTNTFFRHFIPAWRMATMLGNWAKQQLLRHDVRRLPGMTTLPKYIPLELYKQWNDPNVYPAALRSAWVNCSGTACAIVKSVEDTWKDHKSFGRFAVIWKSDASAGTMTFPQPWVVRSQECNVENGGIAYDVRTGQDGQVMKVPIVTFNLPASDDPEADPQASGGKYVLELSTHLDFRRVLADFDRFFPKDGCESEAVALDVKLIAGMADGRIKGAKIAISGRFLRSAGGDPATRVAEVRTCGDALMEVAVPDVPKPWVLHAQYLYGPVNAQTRWTRRLDDLAKDRPDQPPAAPMPSKAEIQKGLDALATKVRRMRHGHTAPEPNTNKLVELQQEAAKYEAWLERYRTDLKFEKRWPADKRKQAVLKAQRRITNHRNRIRSEIQQIAAAVVGYVRRQRCGTLQYDDAIRTLFSHFPWAELRDRIGVLCHERGITFVPVTVDPPVPDPSDESADPAVRRQNPRDKVTPPARPGTRSSRSPLPTAPLLGLYARHLAGPLNAFCRWTR